MTSKFNNIISNIVCPLVILVLILSPKTAFAVDTSVAAFVAGNHKDNVISNTDFIDVDSMTTDQIQAFLVSYNSYLKDYVDTSSAGRNRSAAQIIYEAARGIDPEAIGTAKGISITANTGTINPKLILVYLQKEQSLITKTARDDNALNKAMGYMCPDGSGCDPDYAGFAMQVGWGAWQLRYNYEAAKNSLEWWNSNYGAGASSICYVGQTKVFSDYTGSYSVTLSNAATASVYRYTPHVFDSAYNVWKLFNSWFPATEGEDENEGEIIPPPPPPPPPPRKLGDGNGDSAVDSTDLSILADQWGKSVTADTGADFSKDGVVDSTDLSILADSWGK